MPTYKHKQKPYRQPFSMVTSIVGKKVMIHAILGIKIHDLSSRG